ncbi:hypothetical protein V6N11_038190 [Hibiscus sabdariffa]|uniref:BZIP domain-containing protein n=1 Tax=Hibiscus sabdariffa TaxID=183260 RepID=A0ABR2SJ73_9ROSI
METDERDTFAKPKPSKRKSLYGKEKGPTKFEFVGNYADISSGRSEKESISCKNYTHDPSISAGSGDKASSDGSDNADQSMLLLQDLSAVKNLRLNQKNAHDCSVEEDSAAVIHNTVSRSTKEASELREQKRRQMNRESARRSRVRKKQERDELEARIEALKDDSHQLCKELKNLSEECLRFYEENQQIKDELIRTYGPGIIHDLNLNEVMHK